MRLPSGSSDSVGRSALGVGCTSPKSVERGVGARAPRSSSRLLRQSSPGGHERWDGPREDREIAPCGARRTSDRAAARRADGHLLARSRGRSPAYTSGCCGHPAGWHGHRGERECLLLRPDIGWALRPGTFMRTSTPTSVSYVRWRRDSLAIIDLSPENRSSRRARNAAGGPAPDPVPGAMRVFELLRPLR